MAGLRKRVLGFQILPVPEFKLCLGEVCGWCRHRRGSLSCKTREDNFLFNMAAFTQRGQERHFLIKILPFQRTEKGRKNFLDDVFDKLILTIATSNQQST